MADDIDIEEHDLLDNPRIKNIFPDISKIKKEIPDVESEDQFITPYDDDSVSETHNFRSNLSFESEAEYTRHNNKIILGSKPNQGTSHTSRSEVFASTPNYGFEVPVKEEMPDYYYDIEERMTNSAFIDSSVNDENSEDEVYDIKDSVVFLEDWGPRLHRSPCYCKQCKILFPTRNCLDAHKMSAHSFLVALNVNKAIKSTARAAMPNLNPMNPKNTARKSTGVIIPTTSNSKFCNHCNKTFPDDTSLITHLYDVLTSNKFKCTECNAVFNNEAEFKLHAESHNEDDDDDDDDGSDCNMYYRCNVCNCYFIREKIYRKHMLLNHCVNSPAMSKVSYNSQCSICATRFKFSRYLRRHIQEVHSNLFLKKINPPMQNIDSQYKRDFHLKKFDSVKPQLVKKSYINTNVPSTSRFLIPHSLLFKCEKCQTYFSNCSGAALHIGNCQMRRGDWICPQCRRHFPNEDQVIHSYQHAVTVRFNICKISKSFPKRVLCNCPDCKLYFSIADFRDHSKNECSLTKSAKCVDCDLSISELSVKEHKKCHQEDDMCRSDFILVEFVKPDNIKLKEPVSVTPNESLKRKINEDIKDIPSKKLKLETNKSVPNKVTLYFCTACKCCMKRSSNIRVHITGQCKSMLTARKICKICGLLYSSTKHQLLHKLGLKFKDFQFYRLQDEKPMSAPIPLYPKCQKCNVQFLSRRAISSHECNDSYKTCKYCGSKFSDLAYKIHLHFHEYGLKKAKFTKVATSTPKKSQDLPELLKKYELLTKTWNILYLCSFCDIICDSYDKVVEHSQDHFNKMESYDMVVKKCQICDLKFDGMCFDKHFELHRNPDISKESFNILKYDYTNLLTEEWLKFFGNLPKGQIDQIVSRSLYSDCRNIKMRIFKDGPPEFTVYKCGKCRKHLSCQSVLRHYKSRCSDKQPGFPCYYCKRSFASTSCRNMHRSMHKITKVFRYVLFNDNGDTQFNKALNESTLQSTPQEPESYLNVIGPKHPFMKEITKQSPKYVYFKCKLCECSIIHKDNMRDHNCSSINKKIRCPKCQLWFTKKNMANHLKLHKVLPKFYKKNIKMILFTPLASNVPNIPNRNKKIIKINKVISKNITANESDDKVAKIYKCKCGLHFTTSKAIEKHLNVCGPGYNVSKENCGQCGLLFPTDLLVSHLCSHHSNDKYNKFDVEEVTSQKKTALKCGSCKKAFFSKSEMIKHMLKCSVENRYPKPKLTVYKCFKCNIHYMSDRALDYHYRMNHKVSEIASCEVCGLNFTSRSQKLHFDYHHTKLKCELKDIQIKIIKPTNDTGDVPTRKFILTKKFLSTLNLKAYNRNLYKCVKCGLHFISKQTLYGHTFSVDHSKNYASTTGVDCKICGYTFSFQTLPRHVYIHHEKFKLKRGNLRIIQGATKSNQNAVSNNSSKNDKVDSDSDDDFDKKELTEKIEKNNSLKHSNLHTTDKENVSITENDDEPDYQYQTNTNVIYKCSVCSIHSLRMVSIQKHVFGKMHSQPRIKCEECQLEFGAVTLKRHINYHHKKLNLKREDFEIVDFDLSTIHKCSTCLTHYWTEDTLENHNHSGRKINCELCDLTFSKSNLSRHKAFHHAKLGLTRKDFRIIMQCDSNNTKDGNRTEVADASWALDSAKVENEANPKMKQVYNYSKNLSTINIAMYTNNLYKCDTCDLCFLRRSSLCHHTVLCPITLSKETCAECGYIFISKTLPIHMYVHHERMKLKVEDFRIVKLCDEAADTSEKEVDIDISETASLDVTCDGTSIADTKDMISDSASQEVTCDDTSLADTKDTISDSEENDKTLYNSANIQRWTRTKYSYSKKVLSSINLKTYDNHVYRCEVCLCNFLRPKTLTKHQCKVGSSGRATCPDCGLVFTFLTLEKHRYIQHQQFGLKLEDFCIMNKDFKVIKEKSFVSGDLDETPFMVTDNRSNDELETKINYDSISKKSSESITEDMNYESSQIASRSSKSVRSEVKVNLYKCKICNLHFVEQDGINKHLKYSSHSGKTPQSQCDFCDLNFGQRTLHRHVLKHHNTELNLTLENFIITEFSASDYASPKDDIIVSQSTSSKDPYVKEFSNKSLNKDASKKNSIKLYKCATCNVFFITQTTCYKHVIKHQTLDSKDYIECKLCSFQFRIPSLQKHISLHHQGQFKLENVLVEEYQPVINGTPKIEIYFALDKLQSRLVSTTSEKETIEEPDTTVENATNSNICESMSTTAIDNGEKNVKTFNFVDKDPHDSDISIPNPSIKIENAENNIVSKLDNNKISNIETNVNKIHCTSAIETNISEKDISVTSIITGNSENYKISVIKSENNIISATETNIHENDKTSAVEITTEKDAAVSAITTENSENHLVAKLDSNKISGIATNITKNDSTSTTKTNISEADIPILAITTESNKILVTKLENHSISVTETNINESDKISNIEININENDIPISAITTENSENHENLFTKSDSNRNVDIETNINENDNTSIIEKNISRVDIPVSAITTENDKILVTKSENNTISATEININEKNSTSTIETNISGVNIPVSAITTKNDKILVTESQNNMISVTETNINESDKTVAIEKNISENNIPVLAITSENSHNCLVAKSDNNKISDIETNINKNYISSATITNINGVDNPISASTTENDKILISKSKNNMISVSEKNINESNLSDKTLTIGININENDIPISAITTENSEKHEILVIKSDSNRNADIETNINENDSTLTIETNISGIDIPVSAITTENDKTLVTKSENNTISATVTNINENDSTSAKEINRN